MTREEFEQETRNLRPHLVSIAGRITGSTDEAEDIAQDVLIKLWRMSNELTPPLGPLASVMARHAAIDRTRCAAARHEQRLTPADDRAQDDTTDLRANRVLNIIATLPYVQQTVMRMRLAEGMEYDKIAGIMHTTAQNVRQILSRARKAVLKKYTGNADI